MAPLFSSFTVNINKNFNFSQLNPKLSITSLKRLFQGRNALSERKNSTYSEISEEKTISVYSFVTHKRGKLAKITINPVLLLVQIGNWFSSCPQNHTKSILCFGYKLSQHLLGLWCICCIFGVFPLNENYILVISNSNSNKASMPKYLCVKMSTRGF